MPVKVTQYPGLRTVMDLLSRRYPGDMGIEVVPAVGRWDHFASLMVPAKTGGGCVCMAYREPGLASPGPGHDER
jgi:hypothetical protein